MKRIFKENQNCFILFLFITLFIFLVGCNGLTPTLSDANDIVSFILLKQTGAATIDAITHTVVIEVEKGTNLTNLTPIITVSPDATISPPSGVVQDFSIPVSYTVTAEDGNSQVWVITVTEAYKIRDLGPAGGYIFYVDEVDDYPWTYLEAAPASTEWANKQWGSHGTLIGAIATAIGTGQANTIAIVNWLDNNTDDTWGDVTGKADRAAYLCNELNEGGYSDWFLPSKEELNLMYENLKLYGVGGFADGPYWSSSEDSTDTDIAWDQFFDTGNQYATTKADHLFVRAIRAF